MGNEARDRISAYYVTVSGYRVAISAYPVVVDAYRLVMSAYRITVSGCHGTVNGDCHAATAAHASCTPVFPDSRALRGDSWRDASKPHSYAARGNEK